LEIVHAIWTPYPTDRLWPMAACRLLIRRLSRRRRG
jgi:hypothetical protein